MLFHRNGGGGLFNRDLPGQRHPPNRQMLLKTLVFLEAGGGSGERGEKGLTLTAELF